MELRKGKPPEAKRHSPEMFSASGHCFPRFLLEEPPASILHVRVGWLRTRAGGVHRPDQPTALHLDAEPVR